MLIAFTIIGIIVLIVWACQKSDTGANAYGPPPVGVTWPEVWTTTPS